MEGDHGGEDHKTLIYHAKLHLEKLGYRILDFQTCRAWLQFRKPSTPHILGERRDYIPRPGGKKERVWDRIIVEVETKATKGRVKAKEKLYEDQVESGWTLIVLDVRELKGIRKGFDNVRVRDIKQWLRDAI